MNALLGCRNVVHMGDVHPTNWDASHNILVISVPRYGLQPLSVHQYASEMSCFFSIWCPSSSTSWSKALQESESPDPTQLIWVIQSGPKHAERKDKQSALQYLLFTRHKNTHLVETVNDDIQIAVTLPRQK